MSPQFLIIKARKLNPVLVFPLIGLYIKKMFKVGFNATNHSDTPIDVLIPTVSKDYVLLESVLRSLNHVQQPINKIYIVSKNDQSIIDFCKRHNAIFVDEQSVLGYGIESIDYTVDGGADRRGWIFQQLLKLSGDTIVEKENYLVIDSDTVLIRDFSFIDTAGIFYMQQSYEWNKPYFETYKKLFKKKAPNKLSSVSHMMLFNKTILKNMKNEIEKTHRISWDKAILSLIDKRTGAYFSEYESYANYATSTVPEQIRYVPFYNVGLPRKRFETLDDSIDTYRKDYNSLSFHDYSN